jgi:hypothetical protein
MFLPPKGQAIWQYVIEFKAFTKMAISQKQLHEKIWSFQPNMSDK